MKSRWLWRVLALALLVGGSAYLAIVQPWVQRPIPLAVEIAASGPLTQVLAVNGRVVARQSVAVRSSVAGQVVLVGPEEGAAVTGGDLLVKLDTAQADALVAQAQATLNAGLVRKQQAQAGFDRANALGDNITRSAREDATLALAAASDDVAQLQAALDRARSQLAQYSIIAPFDGTVLQRDVDVGQVVDTQTELFTIADLSEILVETDVDEIYSARMHVGLDALLQPAGESQPLAGKVTFTSPRIDSATGGRTVRISFDAPVDLPVGLTVNANIVVSRLPDVVSVPRGALVIDGTQVHVLLIENGTVVSRPIRFSDWPAPRVVVTEGLMPGDAVILDPTVARPGQAAAAR